MDVEKIDIKKEFMAIPDDKLFYEFLEIQPLSGQVFEDTKVPTTEMTGKRTTYQVQRVYDGNKNVKNYLVRIDDNQIFQDLIKISNATVDSLIQRRLDYLTKHRMIELQARENSTIRSIKGLPFWKRLFNKF